ncbi:metalloprotease [Actinoplanes solisilvae]|uniref:metalloprotease n=1 Tax=Actinoplanes solisilvae TaxID=2486853 RepID=UPI000FD810D0|nr:M50 family metallopeptidase [Actinoplanes solisilvae]
MKTKRPRLREDLVFSRPLQRGPDTVYLVKDRHSGRAYEISPKEQFLMRRLDGTRSLEEIGAEYAVAYGRRLGDDHWTRLLWLLHERDLFSTPFVEVQPRSVRLAGWARRLRWLLHPSVFTLLAVLVAVVLVVVALRIGPLWHDARPAFGDPLSLVALVVLAWAGAALHEFAHGIVAVHFGATVTRINLLLLTCRVEDYLYLPRRSRQVMIAAAGAVANGLVLMLVGAVLAVVPGPLFSAYVLVAAVQTIVNVIPLPPLDGYKIVSHSFGLLNLAQESRRFVLRRGRGYPRTVAVQLGLFAAWWLLAVAAVAGLVIFVAGYLLVPSLGGFAYALPAAVVGLTIAGWLARPRTRKN